LGDGLGEPMGDCQESFAGEVEVGFYQEQRLGLDLDLKVETHLELELTVFLNLDTNTLTRMPVPSRVKECRTPLPSWTFRLNVVQDVIPCIPCKFFLSIHGSLPFI